MHARLEALNKAGLIVHPARGGFWPGLKVYAAAKLKNPPQNLILEPLGFTNYNKGKEYLGYPTQKRLALLEKFVRASSNKGDLVLDPFCGCATTCIAAEKWHRRWVGIDSSEKAYALVRMRLNKEIWSDLEYRSRGEEPILRKDIPSRTDIDHAKKPTGEDKNGLYGAQNGTCHGCGKKFDIYHLEIDHKVPVAQGGGHEIGNLQLLCGHCNRVKGDRPMEYLRARLKMLFDNGTA